MAETYMGMPVGETVKVNGWDELPDAIKVSRFGIGNILEGRPLTLEEIRAIQGMTEQEMIAAGYKPLSDYNKKSLLADAEGITSYYVDPTSKKPVVNQGNLSSSMVTPIEPGMIGSGRVPKGFTDYYGSAGNKAYGLTPDGKVIQVNEPTTGKETIEEMIKRLAAGLTSDTGTLMGFGGRIFHYDKYGNYFESTGDPTASLAGQKQLMGTGGIEGAGGTFSNAFTGTKGTGVPSGVNFNFATTSNTAANLTTSSATVSTTPTGYTGSGTTGDPLKLNGVAFTGSYLGMNFINGASTVSSAAKAERQSAYDSLLAEFNKYGLGSLVTDIKGLIERDVSPSQFIIELRNTPAYQQRFKANTERIKKGLSALSEAQYIQNEDNYRQILRTYGLTQFDNDEYVNQFLVNDVSPQELGERVTTAVNRLQMADPAVTNTLRTYYGLKDSDMIAAILDPKTQLPTIQRQIAAAEIGTAAGRQGLKIGLPVAEQLAAQGVTKQEAERGYATIAEILPTAEKLSDIYARELEGYRLPEAEQEVFNTLASAQRKRQRLVERERAAFSGQSGVGRTSLTEDNRAQF